METRHLNVSKVILRYKVSETSEVLLLYRQSSVLCSYAHTYKINVKLNPYNANVEYRVSS
jgi:hypothetical protein